MVNEQRESGLAGIAFMTALIEHRYDSDYLAERLQSALRTLARRLVNLPDSDNTPHWPQRASAASEISARPGAG